jgi:hypothetical protein
MNGKRIVARKQMTDIGKHSFACGTLKFWKKLPAETLGTFPNKSHAFKYGDREVIISEVK